MRPMAMSVGVGILAGAAIAQPGAEPAVPGWLAGCWIEQKDAGWAEECWTSARGGVMIGSGRTGIGERVSSWETMQIIRDDAAVGKSDGLSFFAAPRGVNRTEFRARADGGPGISFHNAGHDYPQRIRYWREGEFLLAETALADGSRAKRWKFKRM